MLGVFCGLHHVLGLLIHGVSIDVTRALPKNCSCVSDAVGGGVRQVWREVLRRGTGGGRVVCHAGQSDELKKKSLEQKYRTEPF